MPRRGGRHVKPYAWTTGEKRSPKLRRKITRCVKGVVAKQSKRCRAAWRKGEYHKFGPGKMCYNPISVCRSSLRKKR